MAKSDRMLLRDAVKKGLITMAERDAILAETDPAKYASSMDSVEQELRAASPFGQLSNTVSTLFSASMSIGGRDVPVWIVVGLVVLVLATGGVRLAAGSIKLGDVVLPVVSPETVANWLTIGDTPIPVSALPTRGWVGPMLVGWAMAVVAVLFSIPALLSVADNLAPRPNQGSNLLGVVSLVCFVLSWWLWSVWSVILMTIAVVFAQRRRDGQNMRLSSGLFMVVLVLWVWFDIVGPAVNAFASSLDPNNPLVAWIPQVIALITTGDNIRWAMSVILFGALIVSVFTPEKDSSTLIGFGALWLLWALVSGGVLLGFELVTWMPFWVFWVALAVVVLAIVVELYQTSTLPMIIALAVAYGLSYAVTYLLRDQPWWPASDFARILTEPVVVVYTIVLAVGGLINMAFVSKNKAIMDFYKLAGNWMGAFVPLGPFQVPADALTATNLAVAVWLVTNYMMK